MTGFRRVSWLLCLPCLWLLPAMPRAWGGPPPSPAVPPAAAKKPVSAAPLTPEKIRAILDEMGGLRVPQDVADDVLVKDLETLAKYAQSQTSPQKLVNFLKLTLQSSSQREEEAMNLARPVITRFVELEGQLLAEKNPPRTELVRAIKKYSDNALFVLSVGAIAVADFQDEVTPELVDIFNRTRPGFLQVEWAKLAYQLLRSSRREKLIPYYMHVLGMQEYELPMEGGGKYTAEEVQLATMVALGATGEKIILDGLDSADPLMKRSATRLCGDILVEKCADRLAQTLADSGDATVRIIAASSLGALLSYRHAPELERASADANPEIRIAALRALGELALKRSRHPIFTMLLDKNARVRRAAIDALDRYVDTEPVVQRLAEIVKKDESVLIRERAGLLLSRSPLPSASVVLGSLLRASDANSDDRKAIEELVKQQSVEVAHGSLIPQFSVVLEDGSSPRKEDVPNAPAILRQKVRVDKAYSAGELAGLAPGLTDAELPLLREARELIALETSTDRVLSEIDKMNRLMRLIIARRKPSE